MGSWRVALLALSMCAPLAAAAGWEALDTARPSEVDDVADPEVVFNRARQLAAEGRLEEAASLYRALILREPEAPGPYNNLAAIHAQRGELEEARRLLRKAIERHPGYSTLFGNLTALYARQAQLAYREALEEDRPEPPNGPVDLATLVRIDGRGEGSLVEARRSSAPAPVAREQADADEAVRAAVLGWADAWSRQDVEAYLDAYGEAFEPPDAMDRGAWREQRQDRLSSPKFIEVSLEGLKVSLDGDKAVARFLQHYRSDIYEGSSAKLLELEREGDGWKIVAEREDTES